MAELPTGAVTFLFTDLESHSRLWEEHPEAMSRAMARHDALLRQAVLAHGGHVVKGTGDGIHACFAHAQDAVRAAVAGQRALAAEAWGLPEPLRARMGLHTGAAEERDGDYYGPVVNRAARVMQAGHGGQVLLSGVTAARARAALGDGVELRDLGEHRLRDVGEPGRLYQVVVADLRAEFPPPRSLDAVSHNLPVQPTSFVGRDREMAEVKQLVARARLVTLTGAGGAGKTRLALQVAADLVAAHADGVWFVDLAPLADQALVPAAALATLGVREVPGQEPLAALVEHLRARQVLLVLDNCEHLIDASARLAAALLRGCPAVRLLVTSRELLGVSGETAWAVPSLALPDPAAHHTAAELGRCESAQLFVDRALAVQPAFRVTEQNAAALAELCTRLDGIPLALELAAARIRVLTVEQIAARLNDRFRLLTGGGRTALRRQRTLRALVDWSHDLLSERERVLFRRMALFAGGWTLEAAEAVGAGQEVEPHEVLDLLTGLVDKSLVLADEAPDGMRYRCLETIRAYALERLAEAGEAESAGRRHAAYFLALAEAAEPELWGGDAQAAWAARVECEHDNLRAALGWALGQDEVETALRLSGALWRFWELRSHFAEGRRWLEEALARGGSAAARAKAVTGAGTMALHQSDYDRAAALHGESLELYRDLGDRRGEAFALNNLASQLLMQGDSATCMPLYHESLTLAREVGDMRIEAYALTNMGEAARQQGDHARAVAAHTEALARFREMGDRWAVSLMLANLGVLAGEEGDHERAKAFHREGLALSLELGNHELLAVCLEGLMGVAADRGQAGRAARLAGAAETLREAAGAPIQPVDRRLYEAAVAAARARLDDAAFAAAWQEGRAMAPEEAVAHALSDAPEEHAGVPTESVGAARSQRA